MVRLVQAYIVCLDTELGFIVCMLTDIMSMFFRNSHMEGLDLDSDLISDYTAALNDGRSWNRNGKRLFKIYRVQLNF